MKSNIIKLALLATLLFQSPLVETFEASQVPSPNPGPTDPTPKPIPPNPPGPGKPIHPSPGIPGPK